MPNIITKRIIYKLNTKCLAVRLIVYLIKSNQTNKLETKDILSDNNIAKLFQEYSKKILYPTHRFFLKYRQQVLCIQESGLQLKQTLKLKLLLQLFPCLFLHLRRK
jgi:hypothetical protein